MASRINWKQIDTVNIPSGAIVDLGKLSKPIDAIYVSDLFISGFSLDSYVNSNLLAPLNQFTQSVNNSISITGSNTTVIGDFTVNGQNTTINSQNVDVNTEFININNNTEFVGFHLNSTFNQNIITGSLLWDTQNQYWVAGVLGNEEKIVTKNDLDVGIWRQTGSNFNTSNDLGITGSLTIKGDLRVEGTTTLVQTLDNNVESLIVSGAMSIVKNEIIQGMVSASLNIQNLGTLGDPSIIPVLDCGDGFF